LSIRPINGAALLRSVKSEFPELPVVVLTKPKDIRFGILASIVGASDFIQTPVDAVKIRASLDRAIKRKHIEMALLRSETSARGTKRASAPPT
jgi:FixJ family two-component response regulator